MLFHHIHDFNKSLTLTSYKLQVPFYFLMFQVLPILISVIFYTKYINLLNNYKHQISIIKYKYDFTTRLGVLVTKLSTLIASTTDD